MQSMDTGNRMRTRILGLSTAQPAGSIEQSEAARAAAVSCQTARQARMLGAIYRQTGIRRRAVAVRAETHGLYGNGSRAWGCEANSDGEVSGRGPGTAERMRAYERWVLPLAHEAAAAAIREAGMEPREVGQVVAVSCTGFAAPGLDIGLVERLGLSGEVGRTMVGFMGCHGAINGLRVGKALAAQTPGEAVLVCAAEVCSVHYQYGLVREHVLANALFADGAGAVVLRAGSEKQGRSVVGTGSRLVPGTGEAMGWRIGDHGFEMRLKPWVPAVIREHVGTWVQRWLSGYGLTVEEVGGWAIHPGGPRVIDAVVEGLGLDAAAAEASRDVLGRCGNMSSPTVLFIVEELCRRGVAGPYVAIAFGPGLTVEAALLG